MHGTVYFDIPKHANFSIKDLQINSGEHRAEIEITEQGCSLHSGDGLLPSSSSSGVIMSADMMKF